MLRLHIPQVAQRLALVLLGVSLLGYLGFLLSDLYQSRNELRAYQQELLLRDSRQRAQALESFFSERGKDLRSLAELRELQAYFENQALGMSLQYGLAASLFEANRALERFRAKSRMGDLEIYPALTYFDADERPLVEARAPDLDPSARLIDLAPVLRTAGARGIDEAALLTVNGALVATIPVFFKGQRRGRLVALLSVPVIDRRFLGDDEPSKRLMVLSSGDELLSTMPPGAALLSDQAVREVLARGGANDGAPWAAAFGPSGQELSVLRTPIEGTHLALVTFLPTTELGAGSPGALVAVVGGIGALLVLLGLVSIRSYRRTMETLAQVIRQTPFGIVVISPERLLVRANEAAGAILGASPRALVGRRWDRFVPTAPGADGAAAAREVTTTDLRGDSRVLLLTEIPAHLGDEDGYIEAFVDLSERKQLESQLRQAQKLEAVGQLAAGIAHEINTPAQYVNDSVRFLEESFQTLVTVLERYRGATTSLSSTPEHHAVQAALRAVEEEADVAFVVESAPPAFERAAQGVERVASIVQAMREFAHSEQLEKSPSDLNRALQNTLTIARNEYKSVADVEERFEALPPVYCHLAEMNQVFLNLITNAAHAIAQVVEGSDQRGHIRIRSAAVGESVCIEIEDSGCGIPEAIRDRVFDPFFTTKPVGRGMGQGLAVARSVVVDKHGGSLTFRTTEGKGTTFTIVLPIGAPGDDAPDVGRA